MNQLWIIKLYRTRRGSIPVQIFIDSLPLRAQSKVRDVIRLLETYGADIGLPHVKKLKGLNIWELRILGTDSIRLLYAPIWKKTFLLLHGLKKKSHDLPRREVLIALNRYRDFKSRSTV